MEHKWTQEYVAKRLGIDRTGYVRYESNSITRPRKMLELAELFNVSVDYLMCTSDLRTTRKQIDAINKYNRLSKESRNTIDSLINALYCIERGKK
jgi:transcriptional regulator with XRE-family HTH domain